MLTQQQVRTLYDYDPQTGWLTHKSTGARAGSEVFKPDRNGVKQPQLRRVSIRGKVYPETRIIWVWMTGTWSSAKFIDHADTNPFNNAWSNLREANDQESLRNRKPWTATGYKWVYVDKRKTTRPYKARIRIDGKDYHLGGYATPQDAHSAALALASNHHGKFTRSM